MKTVKIIMMFMIITSLLSLSTRVIAEPLEIVKPIIATEINQKELIKKYSTEYNISYKLVSKIIYCESRGKINAIGDNGLSYGVAQFQKPTFNWMKKKLGKRLDYKSESDQIELLSYALSKGWGRNWTSYRAIKSGGKYSFYSRQLKKHFTIYCKI